MDILAVKKYMRENKISQIELAEKSKIPLQTIRKILSGVTPNPRIDTVEAIEKALGLQKEKSPSTLSDDEQRLLNAFRLLADSRKKYILELIEDLIGSTMENEKKEFRV